MECKCMKPAICYIMFITFLFCIAAALSIFGAGLSAMTINCSSQCKDENNKDNEACLTCDNSAERYMELLVFGCVFLFTTMISCYGTLIIYKLIVNKDNTEYEDILIKSVY